jgi:CheY-like chemotaxis protein/HPt (histidine-containing phosphotransfer) domain-containing protein
VKFTEKGEVTLSVSCGGRIGEMHEIHFSVKDTGLGIPGDKVGLIFQPFSQIDASMSRTHAGTGLGLAICRRLVTLMQGRIWVESTPGCGSTFHFTILMRDAGTLPIVCKGDSPGGKEDSCRRKNLRILVAEDNALNQKILQSLLERLGCSADVAASGYEVLEALRRQPYDVVLMDVQMPEMDGIEATRAIRGTFPADMQPAIVAVTAAAFREDRDRCLEAGMDLCLTKPIDLETLRSILERLAASAQPPERLEGPPPLNSARLDELRSLLDDESGLRRLIDLFLKEAGALLGELKEVLAARDVTRACRLAHTLRSSCLNIGADRLAELSLDLEKKIRDADSSLAAAAMEAFVEEHIRVEKAFSSDAF